MTISDIKIIDAKYFPLPDKNLWKELPPLPIANSKDYEKGWIYNGLLVMASVGKYDDGKEWVHISYSRKNRIPEYKDTQLVLKHFVGNKKAIMVFPEEKNYVNINKNCLHLFVCNEENPLPEFSFGGLI